MCAQNNEDNNYAIIMLNVFESFPFFLSLFPSVPPSFQMSTVNVTALPMRPITLPCSTFPDPTLSYAWAFNGVSLSPGAPDSGSPLVLDQEGGALTISNVGSAQEGTYTCTASNNLGSANGTVYLNVLSKQNL